MRSLLVVLALLLTGSAVNAQSGALLDIKALRFTHNSATLADSAHAAIEKLARIDPTSLRIDSRVAQPAHVARLSQQDLAEYRLVEILLAEEK